MSAKDFGVAEQVIGETGTPKQHLSTSKEEKYAIPAVLSRGRFKPEPATLGATMSAKALGVADAPYGPPKQLLSPKGEKDAAPSLGRSKQKP